MAKQLSPRSIIGAALREVGALGKGKSLSGDWLKHYKSNGALKDVESATQAANEIRGIAKTEGSYWVPGTGVTNNQRGGLIGDAKSVFNTENGLKRLDEFNAEHAAKQAKEKEFERLRKIDKERRDALAPDKATQINYDNAFNFAMNEGTVLRRQDFNVTDGKLAPRKKTSPLQAEVEKKTSDVPPTTKALVPVESASTPAQENTSLFQFFDPKLKAARKNGKANAYMADGLQNDIQAFDAHLKRGEFKDAASIIGASGNYSQKNVQKLLARGRKHFSGRLEDGPSMSDYIFGYNIPSTAAGLAVVGGTLAAINSNGGRRSNADLYSSPF